MSSSNTYGKWQKCDVTWNFLLFTPNLWLMVWKSLTAQEKVQKCWKRNQNCAIGVTCVKAKSVSTFVIFGFLLVLLSYLMCWWNIWGATVFCAQMENRFFFNRSILLGFSFPVTWFWVIRASVIRCTLLDYRKA